MVDFGLDFVGELVVVVVLVFGFFVVLFVDLFEGGGEVSGGVEKVLVVVDYLGGGDVDGFVDFEDVFEDFVFCGCGYF